MIPDGIKEKLTNYRKWLQILTKEFINLPFRNQTHFMTMLEAFRKDCNRIHEESKNILERSVQITISSCEETDNGWSVVKGTAKDVTGIIEIRYPGIPKDMIGKKIVHMIYSLDGKEWYSSKSLLIKEMSCSEK